MKSNFVHILVAAALMMGINGFAAAAGKVKVDLGKREFESKCAACHGKSGKGDGGINDLLKKPASDLTVLSKKNGGVFPFDRVYRVIDGREEVKSHGRDMPVWGNEYSAESTRAAEYFIDSPYDMEVYVRARILSLIDYLNRLQSK